MDNGQKTHRRIGAKEARAATEGATKTKRPTKSGNAKGGGTAVKEKAPARPRRSAKSRQVEQAARRYFDAIGARDPEAMAACWSADGVEDIAPLGIFRGPQEIKALFREMFAAMPDFTMTVTRVVANDETAVVQWRATGSFTGGPFQGIRANGKRVELRGADLLDIDDGQIVRNTAFYDGADFARQLGMLPQRDSGAERAMTGAFNTVTRVRTSIKERAGSQ